MRISFPIVSELTVLCSTASYSGDTKVSLFQCPNVADYVCKRMPIRCPLKKKRQFLISIPSIKDIREQVHTFRENEQANITQKIG